MIRFLVFFVIVRLCLGSELSTTSPNSITNQGYSENTTKDGLTKRGIKVDNYDPPPEYYRGPASSSSSSSYSGNRNNAAAVYSSRPVAFPTESYGYKGDQQERKGLHDRLSVGHYTSGASHSDYGNHGYGSSSTAHPYGPPQAIEYEYYAPTGNSHGYSEGGGGGATIPVELYNRGYGGYGHSGEYTTYTVGTGHETGGIHSAAGGHQSGKQGYDKALLAKSFLIPLASAAVLGIAAALASNPLLLQLGTVSSIGKRKRRELGEDLSHSMAYRSQRRN